MSQAYVYGIVSQAAPNGDVDFMAHTIKAMLVGAGYTFNQDTHTAIGSVTSEITATGYSAGGLTLTGKAANRVQNVTTFTSDNPIWTTPDMANVHGLVLYDADAGIPLVYVDFEGAFGQVGGFFEYPVDTAGGWFVATSTNAPGAP